MVEINNRKAYIIGGGIAGLAAATFLIKDGGWEGCQIFIFDQESEGGGSFDGQKSAGGGYSCRGYRMYEESIYTCTLDLLDKIISPTNPKKTLKDDFTEFNKKIKINAKARLIKNGKVIDAHPLGLNWHDRIGLIKLLFLPEVFFKNASIEKYFSPEFFKTNFWFEWATTFAFEPQDSLLEMKRYIIRFIQDSSRIDTMTCVLSAPYSEHDFIAVPTMNWLREKGVNFRKNCIVTDIEFDQSGDKKVVKAISLNSGQDKIDVNPDDLVFLTTGSITADSSAGSMDSPPILQKNKSNSHNLWETIAKKFDDMGDPSVFYNHPKKSKGVSFTITFTDPAFFKRVEKLTSNPAGTGGIITLKDSGWLMSISLPHQPYFTDQPKNTHVCWGYGLLPDKPGDYTKKKMTDCNGREILEELCYHLGFEDDMQAIIASANCVPVLLPYITSQFLLRKKSDRPLVIPPGSKNFACIGQYVEIPDEIVFTVECSVRSAKIAVNKLLNLSGSIPPLYQRQYNIRNILNAIKTISR